MSDETTGGRQYPPTPELDKQSKAIKDGHSQEIGEFLEWLGEQGIVLCEWSDGTAGGRFYETGGSTQQLLARFFGIDLDIIEAERLAILDAIREQPLPAGIKVKELEDKL